jgi:hypothetical protein
MDAPPPPVPVAAAPPQTAGATVVASGRAHPSLLAADVTGAYWVEQGDDAFSIFRVAVGAKPEPLVAGRPGRASALAVDHGTLYFLMDGANGFDLFRIPAAGGRVERVVANIGAEQLAIDASGIYLGTGGGNILRLAPGKSKPVSIAGSVEYSFMSKVAVDDRSVYFSNELDDTPRRIYRVAKTGGDVARVDAGHVGSWGVAATAVYYDDGTAIVSVPKQGSEDPKPTRVRAGSLLAVTTDKLYFIDHGHVGVRDLASGKDQPTPLTLGDDISWTALGDGRLWLARDADILYWQLK